MEGESLRDCVILDQRIILYDEMMIVQAAKWPEDQDLVLCNQDHHNWIITGTGKNNNWQALIRIIVRVLVLIQSSEGNALTNLLRQKYTGGDKNTLSW